MCALDGGAGSSQGIQQTFEVTSSTSGRRQIRIRPQQSTIIVGFSNGPSFKGGNSLINSSSIGAGDSGTSEGTRCATVFLANNSASQGTVTGNFKHGMLDSRVHCQGHCPIPTVRESPRQAVEV